MENERNAQCHACRKRVPTSEIELDSEGIQLCHDCMVEIATADGCVIAE